MFGLINPFLLSLMAKEKLDEIIKGIIPDGYVQVERTETLIRLRRTDPAALQDITLNALSLSITYKGIEFILSHA